MANITVPPLWLASTSRYRQALLTKLTTQFQTRAPNVDETALAGESPTALVSRLALAKAQSVAAELTQGLVIGSDQVAVFNGAIIGKPHTVDKAVQQLSQFSGQKVQFLTGLVLFNAADGSYQLHVDSFDVWFRQLTGAEIRYYIAAEQPLDCAGSFKSEGLGIALFDKLSGDDPNSLVGLPLLMLNKMLIKAGVNLLSAS